MTVRPVRSAGAAPARFRVITGDERPRLRRALVWAFYTLMAVAAFLVLIYLRTAVDEVSVQIRRLEYGIEVEQARQHQLYLEKIRLESPEEIVPIAEQMLGMVLPEDVVPVTVVRVAGSDSSPAISVGYPPKG